MSPIPPGNSIEDRLAELKEVKLKLPLRHHVSLHSLKLLRNQSISTLVADALDVYFAKASVPAARAAGAAVSATVHVTPGPDDGGVHDTPAAAQPPRAPTAFA